jgi:hypothetical protein
METNDPKGAAGNKKAPMNLLPPHALEQTSWVHKFGSERYGPYNWRVTGVCASTYVSAIMRHLNAWRDGEDVDPESGRSHIAHIAASCNILLDAEHCGTLQDDRNKKPAVVTALVAESLAQTPPYPPVPEGFSHWVDRGMGWKSDKVATYAARASDWWLLCPYGYSLGNPKLHYLEAVAESPTQLPYPPHPPVPEGFSHWVDRGMGWKTNKRTTFVTRDYYGWSPVLHGCSVGYKGQYYLEAIK